MLFLHELHPLQARTIELARQSIGLSEPNPRVGCVITSPAAELLAEGHTQAAGFAHAEVHALAEAARRGLDVRGATAWVSLEPCSHHGRTPPCCDALVQAGIRRVQVAVQDPNPLVAGKGLQRLREAGLEVEVAGGAWARASRELNIGFFSRMERGLPWVRLKMAASLDGVTALHNGESQWITGEAARADGHAWRKQAGAVLTGIGTVKEDDPRMDVRAVPTAMQPLRVIVDSRLEIMPKARILQPPGRCLVYTACSPDDERRVRLLDQLSRLTSGEASGPDIEIATLPALAEGPSKGKADLRALVHDLALRGINELHVEAGEKLSGSLLRDGLVDELLIYLAPRLLGPGRGLAAWTQEPLQTLAQGLELEYTEVSTLGRDLRIRARPL